jgi:hypothetical protein
MYCKKIQLPFDIETPGFPGESITHYSYDYTKIDSRLLNFLEQVNIYITYAEVFYSPPQTRIPIHQDAPNLKCYTKLNICQSSLKSYMNWYSVKSECKKQDTKVHNLNRPYIEYTPEEVILEHTECIHGVYLVNAGVPHDSTNFTNIPRYTLSLGLNDSKITDELSFEQAINRLKSVVV